MDVKDVVVRDSPKFLARSMTVNVNGKKVSEHVYVNERRGEMIYRLVDPATRQELEDERVISVKQEPLRLEFFHRHKSDGYRSYWTAPVDVVKKLSGDIVSLAAKFEASESTIVGLGFKSEAISDV